MGCLLLSSKFDFLCVWKKRRTTVLITSLWCYCAKCRREESQWLFFLIQHNQSNPKITHRVVINCTSCAFDAVHVKYRSWSSVSVFVASTQVQNRLCSISAKMALYFLLFLRILWRPAAVCTTISSLTQESPQFINQESSRTMRSSLVTLCWMSLCGTVHAPGRACVSPVSSRVMHMWLWVPCKFYQRDQLLTGRAGVSSWPSHRALSAGVLECSGMWGSDRWRGPWKRQPSQTEASTTSPPSILLFPASFSWVSGNFHLLLSPRWRRRRETNRRDGLI